MITKWYEDTSDTTSRYRRVRRIELDDTTVRMETVDLGTIEESDRDIYYTVTSENEHRLDLISYKMYGTPLYWWAIAIASDIDDPFTVPAGTVLRIPHTSTVFSLEGVLGNA